MSYGTSRRRCRYRYANGSRKQRKFADGHVFAKRAKHGVTPAKFPAHKVGARATYAPPGDARTVEIFTGTGKKGERMWKSALTGMKQHAKLRAPESYRKRLGVRGRTSKLPAEYRRIPRVRPKRVRG